MSGIAHHCLDKQFSALWTTLLIKPCRSNICSGFERSLMQEHVTALLESLQVIFCVLYNNYYDEI